MSRAAMAFLLAIWLMPSRDGHGWVPAALFVASMGMAGTAGWLLSDWLNERKGRR